MHTKLLSHSREAVQGFATCVSCGFENFARLVRCALCGLPSSFPRRLKATVLPLADTQSQDLALPPICTRREWTREMDGHSNLVWRRRLAEETEHSTGYVLRFDLSPEEEPEPERKALKQRERSLSSGYISNAGVIFELLESRDVDSTKFAMPPVRATDLPDTKEHLRQIAIEIAAQDFPTKYAHFITSATLLLQAEGCPLRSHLAIDRKHVLKQSLQHIDSIREDSIRSVYFQISIAEQNDVLRDEKSIGSLHREWLTLLSEQLTDPKNGLFSCTQPNKQTFFINSQSECVLGSDHLQYFHATGRLIGRALLEGAVLNFHLCRPLLKMMLGTPITFNDLEYLDADMYHHLTSLLDNDGAEVFELDFTVTRLHCNQTQLVELIPTGRNIQVNDDNKFEFADRKWRFLMFESVAAQLASFLKGFYEVVPQQMLLPFDYEELDYLLCGSDEINVLDWQLHTHLALKVRQEVTWFWDVVKEMSRAYQLRLLHFATGYSRVPLVGFQGLTNFHGQLCKFTLIDACGVSYFQSHACSNTLELPFFETKDDLRTALYAALYDKNMVDEAKVL